MRSRAKKTVVEGITFPSKLEAARYIYLNQLLDEGLIQNLRIQCPFLLIESFEYNGSKLRPTRYIADFMYIYNGREYIEDTKAKRYKDPVYLLKKKLFLRILKPTPYLFYEVYEPTQHPSTHRIQGISTPRKKTQARRKNRSV